MTFFSAVYTKDGATFANATEALADKNSLYGPEFSEQVYNCYAQMYADGVLYEPVYYLWDQASYTLTIVKNGVSLEAYNAAVTFDSAQAIQLAADAGWTYIPNTPV